MNVDLVLDGEVYLLLDDGAELLVKAGHSVIQNDTRHAWENRSAKNCVVAVAVIGAVHSR